MWQAQLQQWQQIPAFLTQINWPQWLAIVGMSSAISSIVVLLVQGLKAS
jgi:negative regulator of sigma E activity